MIKNIDTALTLIFGHEGAFSDRDKKADPGGATMYGITAATLGVYRHLGRDATKQEVAALTKVEARSIAIAYYARPIRFDDLPSGVDYAVLDFSINSGPGQAVRTAQRVVGARQDGVMGLATISAIEQYGATRFVQDYCDARIAFMKRLKNWSQNSRGWTIRVTGEDPKGQWGKQPGVLGHALKMASVSGPVSFSVASLMQVSEEGGDAKADPTQVGLLSTTTGQGAAMSAGGTGMKVIGEAQETIDQIKAPLEPLLGTMDWITTALWWLSLAGTIVLVAGVCFTLYGKFRNIKAGQPS